MAVLSIPYHRAREDDAFPVARFSDIFYLPVWSPPVRRRHLAVLRNFFAVVSLGASGLRKAA